MKLDKLKFITRAYIKEEPMSLYFPILSLGSCFMGGLMLKEGIETSEIWGYAGPAALVLGSAGLSGYISFLQGNRILKSYKKKNNLEEMTNES